MAIECLLEPGMKKAARGSKGRGPVVVFVVRSRFTPEETNSPKEYVGDREKIRKRETTFACTQAE